jgi:hypothetical protein
LIKRDITNIKRNPLILRVRLIQTIILAIITGGIFWDLSKDYSQKGLSKGFYSTNGACFFISIAIFMTSLNPIILTFPFERAVFLK